MTNEPSGRIDLEVLAAYIDGRLTADERAAVERQLAADPDSYELLVEVMRTQEALGERKVSPRNWMWLAGSVAAAAAVILAVWLPMRSATPDAIDTLVNAVNGERYVEPRLTGGFPGGPIRSTTRGASPTIDPSGRVAAPLDASDLALLKAVVEAQTRARTEPTADNLHAWGVSLILVGSRDDAIDTLESAARLEPNNAAILSDLAAAYAVRASSTQSAQDWSSALDRSERALRLDDAPLEAAFNRAVALEALRLDGARAAWEHYLERDSNSEWAVEARERLSRLSQKPQGSRRRDNEAAIRAALDGTDHAALNAAVARDPQRAREWLEEQMTREWSNAVIDRDAARETRARERGQRLLAAYSTVAQDALPGAALTHLWSRVPDRAAVAVAVQQFADAAQLVREDRLAESTPILTRIIPVLRLARSPLEFPARLFIVLDWSQQGRLQECLDELDRLQTSVDPLGYAVLSGTIRNRRGQIFNRQGNQEGAIRQRTEALEFFARAGDLDQVAVMHSMLAEAYRYLGDTRTAWAHHEKSLALLAETPNHRSRHLVLVQAGLTATLEGQFDAAIAFQRQVVDNGRDWQRASGTATGFLHQARNAFRLGRLDEADVAIREARAHTSQIPDVAFKDRIELELLEVEGEVFGNREPQAGLPVLSTAIERFSKQGFALRLANLLLWRGRLHARAGDTTAAEADWQRAAAALESERKTVSSESLRLAQAGQLRSLYNEIAWSRVRQGRSAAESLEPLERGRARTLVEAALNVTQPDVSLVDLQRQLDAQTGILHYAVSESEAAAWLTTRDDVALTRLPISARELAVLVDRQRQSSPQSRDAQLSSARELHRVLIAPLGRSIQALTSLVIVPDPALAGVSFAALNDPATGQFLIESKTIAMAPSAALPTEAAPRSTATGVLLVGADRPEAMPALPWVSRELERLSAIHRDATVLSGREATRERLMAEAPRASVIHFAGHAIGNSTNPLLSRLVLHRGADARADLYAYELGAVNVTAATVVLAACRTGYAGAGLQDDDGVLAMARPFLARGARAVLATYRDVSDSGAPVLMEQFHRHLKSGMTPAQAWQATAVQALRSSESFEWTSYAVFLGRGSLATTHARSVTED